MAKLWEGYKRSIQIFKEFRPHALVALGGFACFAPALAARRLGIPLFVQEQNCVAGRANILISLLSKGVFVPVDTMKWQFPFARVIPTGNPVRPSAISRPREEALRELGLSANKFTILVLGGSQGAHFLNDVIIKSLERLTDLKDDVQWIHLAGGADAPAIAQAYAAGGWRAASFDFYHHMGLCYGACDLVVSRAGASTIAEIMANSLASVLVPYPQAMRNHQQKNAQVLCEKGAAVMLDQDPLTPSALATVLRSLLQDDHRLVRMRQAAHKLYPQYAANAIVEKLAQAARERRT